MKNKLLTLLAVLFLSACSLPPYKPMTIKALLPVGANLILTQPIEIPADRSYMYIQGGRVMPLKNYNTVNVRYPYCTLHLQSITTTAFTIMPGQFKVTKVVEWEDYHDTNNRGQFMNASGFASGPAYSQGAVFKARRMSIEESAGLPTVMYATIMTLSSAQQPEVKSLVCGYWEDLGVGEPLSLDDMKSALGDLIQIEKKQSKAI